MRKAVPTAAAVVCGLVALVDFFLRDPTIDAVGAVLAEGVAILAAFALLLGILNLLGVHTRRVIADGKGNSRGLSLLLALALLITLVAGTVSPTPSTLGWIYAYLYQPLQSTMTALLAFFLTSAAYRAFRLRSVDALILLVSSLVMVLVQAPFSETVWPTVGPVRQWLISVPITAGTRGIILGTALGTIATALRILFGVDKPYAGLQEPGA